MIYDTVRSRKNRLKNQLRADIIELQNRSNDSEAMYMLAQIYLQGVIPEIIGIGSKDKALDLLIEAAYYHKNLRAIKTISKIEDRAYLRKFSFLPLAKGDVLNFLATKELEIRAHENKRIFENSDKIKKLASSKREVRILETEISKKHKKN